MTQRLELLKVKEAARRFRVHEETLRTWIRKGVVPHVRIGPSRLIRLREQDLEAVITPDDVTAHR